MKKVLSKILNKTHINRKITRNHLEKFIKKYKSNRLTLDIGCDISRYAQYFPNRIGLDIKKGEKVDLVGSIYELPFEENKFDNILCTEVLEHLTSPKRGIKEMKRVLKQGGTIILSTRFLFPLHGVPDDYYRFTKYGLQHLFKDWEIVELREEVNTLETFSVLLQRVCYQCKGFFLRPLKLLIFIIAKIIPVFSFLIKEEYGDKKRTKPEKNIMISGYYLVARKK